MYSGKLVLDHLGFDVEIYYASETDSKALMVTDSRHGDRVQHVGDVCRLTSAKV